MDFYLIDDEGKPFATLVAEGIDEPTTAVKDDPDNVVTGIFGMFQEDGKDVTPRALMAFMGSSVTITSVKDYDANKEGYAA